MANVVKFSGAGPYSKTVRKMIDGVYIDFIDIDESPLVERCRYFYLSAKRKALGDMTPSAVIVPITSGRRKQAPPTR